MDILPPNYVAGLVDGEGCFALKFRRDVRHERKNKPVYFSWDIEFAVVLRSDDRELLEKVQNTIGCGKISTNQRNSIRLSVQNTKELNSKIVPFFAKNRLYGKKRLDFNLWKEAVEIFFKNQRKSVNVERGKRGFVKTKWNPDDLERLKVIHKEMKIYKSHGNEWKWLGAN